MVRPPAVANTRDASADDTALGAYVAELAAAGDESARIVLGLFRETRRRHRAAARGLPGRRRSRVRYST